MNNNKETSLVKPVKITPNEEKKPPYPKAVFFIIGNEFCERFSYYGMKTILTLYFLNRLSYSESLATLIYHVFASACYFTPIFGAIISDSFLGKFRTIFYISIVYVTGTIVISISSVPTIGLTHQAVEALGMIGLGLIAFGTGGIKPCVAAFGGDQFTANQEKELQRFFSFFYIAINGGSLISTFITPILRNTHCLGEVECFPLAFGVPAVLMVVALILFVCGKRLYTIVPPKGNVLMEVCSCICYAIKKKCQSKGVKRETWLDYADDKYEQSLIDDIKPVLRVLKLYLPLPFFWALFDQQGSRWTLQATKLDGAITENITLYPDQVQFINPLLIILFVPFFEYVIYPAFAKIHFLVKPLQRMVVGGLVAASSFVIAFFLQLAIERTLPVLPDAGHGQLTLFNAARCSFKVVEPHSNITLQHFEHHVYKNIPSNTDNHTIQFHPVDCEKEMQHGSHTFVMGDGAIETLLIYHDKERYHFLTTSDSLEKPKKGYSDVRVLFSDTHNNYDENSTFILKNADFTIRMKLENFTVGRTLGSTDYYLVTPGKYSLFKPRFENETEGVEGRKFTFKSGGKYVILISELPGMKKQPASVTLHTLVPPNSISLFLQIPQYVVITFGEVMFAITGLEFSYSQAPVSMKSVLQAGWLMTVAVGNLIVVIVSKAAITKQSTEFITFACMLAVVMCIFAIMAYFYKPVKKRDQDPEQEEATKDGHVIMNGKSEKGKANEAFVDDTTKM